AEQSWLEKAKLLEVLLRSVPPEEVSEAVEIFVARWRQINHGVQEIPKLLRTLFNEVALSPHTDFVDKTLAFLQRLVDGGHLDAAGQVDFLSYLLRQLGRHLTAYDLITFHHRGANYPDALLLDAVLKVYFRLIERHPELFATDVMRRRALRQGWL